VKRRAKLRGRSTRQTKLKLLSTFCAIDSPENSRITMATLASAEPLTLSTNPRMRSVTSAPRGPSGAKKLNSSGSSSRWKPSAFSTENANASSGTIASIVV